MKRSLKTLHILMHTGMATHWHHHAEKDTGGCLWSRH
jgi:hypothetical protein